MTKVRTITIQEYGRIYAGDVINEVQITKKDITELKQFIDESNENSQMISGIEEYLKPIRNGVQANNYVGVLKTKSGLTIEILPKIAKKHHDIKQIKNLFINMLKTVNQVNGKVFDMTNLSINNNSLMEIFISMFLQEVNEVIRRGLKSDYITLEKNESYLKGRLNIQKQIQLNAINKTKFYSKFDEYNVNIPENQILKKALLYLKKESKNSYNQKLLNMYLDYFEAVNSTHHIDDTLRKIKRDREYAYYDQPLYWAEIFLKKKSFTSFTGTSLAYALLFPMEKVFEAYVAQMIKRHFSSDKVYIQDNRYYLFNDDGFGRKLYRLKPDIVIKNNETNAVTIIDTKWKQLNIKGPSQNDLYQMYAYHSRYKHHGEQVEKVILLYPKSEEYDEKIFISKKIDSIIGETISATIEVVFIDLLDEDWVSNFEQKL